MDTRLASTHGIWRSLIAASVALALLMTLGATSAVAASPSACRVQNAATGKTYTALQAAVDAASKGARLTVRGTCHGTVVIDKSVLVEGIRAASRPLLAGDREGVVLTIRKGVSVKVADLAIEGGRGHFRKGGSRWYYDWPAGVLNHGNLTLRDVTVRLNHGLGVENTGRLRLNGNALVEHNGGLPAYEFKGIHNSGTLRLNGTASVRSPDAVENDGILVMNGASSVSLISNRGIANLNDSSSGSWMTNRGRLTLGDQSQIGFVHNHARMILNDASRLSGNTVINDDGATMTLNGSSSVVGSSDFVNEGTLTLNGSASIRDGLVGPRCGSHGFCSTGPIGGGGVTNSGTLILNDASTISANTVWSFGDGSYGGGVYLVRDASLASPPSLTMTGSSTISGNSAGDHGGGVYAGAGSVLNGVSCGPQTLANVYANTPDDCYFEP